MLALFSPPVLLFDKCAFVCTLIQYISRFATCQANFSCKLRAREKKKAFSCSNLFDNGWKLSFWCGDSHDWDGAQRNRSCGSRSYAWIFPFMWRQPRLRWSVSGIEVALLVLMPESFRSCGDSHTSMQRQRNRSSLARRLNLSFQPHRLPYLYQISI